MTQTVLNISKNGYRTLTLVKSRATQSVTRPLPKSELIFLGVTLAFLQLLDGLLTGIGVMHFGSEIEANIIIRTLIDAFGLFPALLLVKCAAIAIVVALCSISHKVRWVGSALKGIIVLYLLAAIIPWAMVLTFHVA